MLRAGLQWHWSCHSNEMTPFPILLTAVFLGSGNGSSHIVHGSVFPPIATSMFEKFNPTIVRRAVSYALTMCSIKWLFSRSMFISFDLVKQRRGILQCLSTQQRLLYLLQEIKMMIYQLLTSTRLQERRDMGWFHMSKEVQLLPRIRTDLCLPVRRLVRFLSSPTCCWILCALFMQLRSDRGKSWRLYAARTSLNKSLFFIYKNRLF